MQNVRITLNRRAATAAPAMVKRMITRSSPRVFLLVEPFRYTLSDTATAIVADCMIAAISQREMYSRLHIDILAPQPTIFEASWRHHEHQNSAILALRSLIVDTFIIRGNGKAELISLLCLTHVWCATFFMHTLESSRVCHICTHGCCSKMLSE